MFKCGRKRDPRAEIESRNESSKDGEVTEKVAESPTGRLMALQCVPAYEQSNGDHNDDENYSVHVKSVEPLYDCGLYLGQAHEKSRVAEIECELRVLLSNLGFLALKITCGFSDVYWKSLASLSITP